MEFVLVECFTKPDPDYDQLIQHVVMKTYIFIHFQHANTWRSSGKRDATAKTIIMKCVPNIAKDILN